MKKVKTEKSEEILREAEFFKNFLLSIDKIRKIIANLHFLNSEKKELLDCYCHDVEFFIEEKNPKIYVMHAANALRELIVVFFGFKEETKNMRDGYEEEYKFDRSILEDPKKLNIEKYSFAKKIEDDVITVKDFISEGDRNKLLRECMKKKWHRQVWDLNARFAGNENGRRRYAMKIFFKKNNIEEAFDSAIQENILKKAKNIYSNLSTYVHSGRPEEVMQILNKKADERSGAENEKINKYIEAHNEIYEIFKEFRIPSELRIKAIDKEDELDEIISIISESEVAKRYFYEKKYGKKIDKSSLLELKEKDVFQLQKSVSVEVDGYYKNWPEGRFLLKCAKDEPKIVYDIVKDIDTTKVENPLVFEAILEILVVVSEKSGIRLEKILEKINNEKWFKKEKGRALFMSYRVEELITRLIKIKKYNEVSEILKFTLLFKRSEDYTDESIYSTPEPILYEHSLEQILKKLSVIKFTKEGELIKIVKDVSKSLDQLLVIQNEIAHRKYSEEDKAEDYSLAWMPEINIPIEEAVSIRSIFVCVLRDIFINSKEVVSEKSFKILSDQNHRVFSRLIFYLLSRIDKIGIECIANQVKKEISLKYINNELVLIKDKKDDLNITGYLTKEEKKKFNDFIKKNINWQPKVKFGGVVSGPNSRYSMSDIEEKKSNEVVELFIEDISWFEEDNNKFNPELYSPRGTGRMWQEIVAKNPEVYLEEMNDINIENAPLIFIIHYISGINDSIKDSSINFEDLLELLEKIINKKNLKEETEDSFSLGSGTELRLSILRLLQNILRNEGLPIIDHKETVWSMIKKIYESCSFDESFVEDNGKDYFAYSINSVEGVLLHVVYQYAFWAMREGHKDYPSEVSKFIHKLIDNHIGYKTGVSVMGHYLPKTFQHDKKTFNLQKENILPLNDENKDLRYVAWETYLANNLIKDLYSDLRDHYEKAINELDGEVPERSYSANPENFLVQHIAIGYIEGFDNDEITLLDVLLEKNKEGAIIEMISYIGSAYIRNKSQDKVDKIKEIWDKVIKLNLDSQVYEKFGWWVSRDFFNDDKWLIKKLLAVVKKTDGAIDPSHIVLEELEKMTEGNERDVAHILKKIIGSGKNEDIFSLDADKIKKIIEKINSIDLSGEEEIKGILNDIKRVLVEQWGLTEFIS